LRRRPVHAVLRRVVYALRGEAEPALAFLERAVAAAGFTAARAAIEPEFETRAPTRGFIASWRLRSGRQDGPRGDRAARMELLLIGSTFRLLTTALTPVVFFETSSARAFSPSSRPCRST
jgi:hypothetical protein